MEILIIIILIGIFIGIVYFSRMSFVMRKSRLMNMYSSLVSDMNVDFRDNRIGAMNIVDISQSIRNFSNEIIKIKNLIQDKDHTEQEWLVDLIEEFNTNLHLWIERHTGELKIQNNTIGKISASNISEKSILELASKRLENQIKILERI